MLHIQGDDLTGMLDKLTRHMVWGQPDLITNADTHIFDVVAQADSCNYELDLKQVWLTPSRWGALVRQYVDVDAYDEWLDSIEQTFSPKFKRGIAFMRMNEVKTREAESTGKKWRRWGACMLGMSFRSLPRPHLTLYSRTSYVGYLAFLDIALAHVIARDIAEHLELSVGDISFTWHLESASYHPLKSLSWFYRTDKTREMLEGELAQPKEFPSLARSQREIRRIWKADEEGTPYGETAYVPFIRIRKRYHTEVRGPEYGEQFVGGGTRRAPHLTLCNLAKPLPSSPVDSLDLSSLRR